MLIEGHDFPSRLARHAALADPARLRIVDALQISDLAPSEIQAGLGMTSSLLAHHLGVLADAGLIERTRSEADRRRTYVRLAPGARGMAGVPALPAPSRVVFVCTGNSARSQLAARLWERDSGIPAASAGTRPATAVAPGALDVAARRGLDFTGSRPRPLDGVLRDDDWVIAVCDEAHEQLGGGDAAHWSIPDPVRVGSPAAFDRAFDDIAARIGALIPQFTTTTKDAP